MTKKKPDKDYPKRSTRKKFDIPIDPEIEAWSKKLFHPIKPIIDGMKYNANKSDPDLKTDSDKKSPSLINPFNNNIQATEILSETDEVSDSDIISPSDNFSDTDIETISDLGQVDLEQVDLRSKLQLKDRSFDQDQLRSEDEISSVSEEFALHSLNTSESDILTDPENLSAKTNVPYIKGELRIPNYLLKGLLPTLSNSEFVVYLWLYFLSYGFNKNSCYVSARKLAESVNLTDRTIFRTLNSLESRGLIKRINRHFLGKAGGLTFQVNLPETDNLSATDNSSEKRVPQVEAEKSATDKKSYNKDHDHDPKKIDSHERRTIDLYQDLTANIWTPTDKAQYLQIKDLPIEKIELEMRLIASRVSEPIRSFAYFAKSIKSGGKVSRSLKSRMIGFINETRTIYVGAKLTIADLEEAVRAKCEANGLVFDKSVFNELITSRKK